MVVRVVEFSSGGKKLEIFSTLKILDPLDLLKPNTKTQNIFCYVNENLTTLLYTLTGAIRKQKEKKVFSFKEYTKVKCNWVLVFSFSQCNGLIRSK